MGKAQASSYEFEIFKQFSNHDIYPIAEEWQFRLRQLRSVLRAEISGELRRGKPAVARIELVVAAEDKTEFLVDLKKDLKGISVPTQKDGRVELLLQSGIPLVIWICKTERFVHLLMQTTGSDRHWLQLSQVAEELGVQIGADGIQDGNCTTQFACEEDLYTALGLSCIPPELREDICDLADLKRMPLDKLIKESDLQSDLHIHTVWTDGDNSVMEMAQAARAHGLHFISICDHSPYMFERYNDHAYLLQQAHEIEKVQQKLGQSFTILKGVEVDILPDGSLDLPDDILGDMDIVVASMHVELDQPLEQTTARLIRAIEHPLVNIIGHPGGRMYPAGDIVHLDWEKVYRAAADHQVALEINSHKSHPLLDDQKAREAARAGALISINSDSHDAKMVSNTRFGIAIARRAGLMRDQVINTWPLSDLQMWLQQKRAATAAG